MKVNMLTSHNEMQLANILSKAQTGPDKYLRIRIVETFKTILLPNITGPRGLEPPSTHRPTSSTSDPARIA
jgi:hypothetical protein